MSSDTELPTSIDDTITITPNDTTTTTISTTTFLTSTLLTETTTAQPTFPPDSCNAFQFACERALVGCLSSEGSSSYKFNCYEGALSFNAPREWLPGVCGICLCNSESVIPNKTCSGATLVPTGIVKVQTVPSSFGGISPNTNISPVTDGPKFEVTPPSIDKNPETKTGGINGGLSTGGVTGIVGGLAAVVVISVLATMFLVNKVRKRGAFAKTNEAESKESSPRMMPWDDSTSDAPAAGAVVLPSSGKSARKPSATASELELPELVTLTLEEGDWGRRNNDDDVGFSAGSDMPAADALLKKTPTLPIVVTDENGLDIFSNASMKSLSGPLMDVIPGTIAAPAVDGEGDAPSAAWTPEMIWEWEQYQWAYQWHEWQMKQREWQSQVRQKYLEKEAKRLGNEQTKEPPVMKVKPPKVYKPSPLSRPISMSTIASTRSSMFSERESVLLDGQVFTLERSVGIDVHDDEKLDTLSFMSRARSVSSKMSRTVSHSRSISDSSIQSPSLSDNSLTVILVTSPEWAAPPDVVPCDTQTDRHFSTLPSPTRQRSVSSKADVSSFNTSSSSSRLSISSISSSATGTTFRASSFSLANPSIDSDISVLTISSIAPDGTHHSTQTATLCSPSVPLSSSPEPETYPTLPPASVEITTPSVVEQSYPVTVAHTPADKDELELRVGELVVLWKIHDDGFCYGYSVNSRLSGLFPIECVGPPQV